MVTLFASFFYGRVKNLVNVSCLQLDYINLRNCSGLGEPYTMGKVVAEAGTQVNIFSVSTTLLRRGIILSNMRTLMILS